MKHDHSITEMETVYDELRITNPQGAANLGVIIDRIEEDRVLSPDHKKILSLYMG